ncbi:MAG: phytanoyl-CoA dioxygenase family protein [Pseudomonadota bacterium]
MPLIDDADVAAYQRDGAVCLRQVLAAEWLQRLRDGVDENLKTPGPHAKFYTPNDAPGFFFGDYCNWQRIIPYRETVFQSPAAEIAQALMKSAKVNFFHEHVLVKEPNTGERTPWHHDQPYWVVDGNQVCSIWIPLDPVPQDVCVEFIAGSHRWNKWYTPKRFADSENHPSEEGESLESIDEHREAHTFLSWALEPGDCIVFHALTVHGAPGNSSLRNRRRAVALRWTGDDARFVRRKGFMSPPFDDVDLAEGSLMDSPHFPVIIPATQ